MHLTSVRGSNASNVWAVGAQGTILHYDGVTWQKVERAPGTPTLIKSVRGVGYVFTGKIT